jgi:hypothetical protein
MEEHEGHDIAVRLHWRLLVSEHEPLHRLDHRMEKTMLDDALHVCVGNVGAVP